MSVDEVAVARASDFGGCHQHAPIVVQAGIQGEDVAVICEECGIDLDPNSGGDR